MDLLKAGDRIGVVAPGSPIPADMLKKGVVTLEKMGFKVELGKHIFDVTNYTAGTAIDRAFDINNFFSDPKIKAIIAARGGYNCNQVIPYLNYDLMRRNPKIFLGLSDVTAILNAITVKSKITTFHAPVVLMMGGGKDNKAFSQFSRNKFLEIVLGKNKENIKIKNAKRKWAVLRHGQTNGKLFGGNLHSIISTLGTEYEPTWRNAIFFWECIDDRIENISQMLTHLKLAKVFDKTSGMIIGKLMNIHSKGIKCSDKEICKMISELLKDYNFPIIYGVDFGHVNDNTVLPIGGEVSFGTKNDYIKLLRY